MQRTIIASFAALATVANAQCNIPEVNTATVNLIAEFEGFRANICKSGYTLSRGLLPPKPLLCD